MSGSKATARLSDAERRRAYHHFSTPEDKLRDALEEFIRVPRELNGAVLIDMMSKYGHMPKQDDEK